MKRLDFKQLLNYYRQCFELIDVFHFNSNIARKQYQACLNIRDQDSIVVPITHYGITDHRKKKGFSTPILNIGFIGHETSYKGLSLLKEVLSQLDNAKWKLNVWGGKIGKENDLPIFYRGKFTGKNIALVFDEMDLLVVPSLWKETFSLVTLEAISFGVPVLVSDNVGAQDIVKEFAPEFIYKTKNELKEILYRLLVDRNLLRRYNLAILERTWEHDMDCHAQEIIEKVYLDKRYYA